MVCCQPFPAYQLQSGPSKEAKTDHDKGAPEDENITLTFYFDILPTEVLHHLVRYFSRLPHVEIWENHVPLKQGTASRSKLISKKPTSLIEGKSLRIQSTTRNLLWVTKNLIHQNLRNLTIMKQLIQTRTFHGKFQKKYRINPKRQRVHYHRQSGNPNQNDITIHSCPCMRSLFPLLTEPQ